MELAHTLSSVQGGDEPWYTSDEEEEIKKKEGYIYPENHHLFMESLQRPVRLNAAGFMECLIIVSMLILQSKDQDVTEKQDCAGGAGIEDGDMESVDKSTVEKSGTHECEKVWTFVSLLTYQ